MTGAIYTPCRAPLAKVRRRFTQWRCAAPLRRAVQGPTLSVSFDDFPVSAAETGRRVVESVGARATYYYCPGLAGSNGPMGPIAGPDALSLLHDHGHEIGSHGAAHLDYARASLPDIRADLEICTREIRRAGVGSPVRSFAYPYGETRREAKTLVAERFPASRGILAGLNSEGSDAAQLRAAELTPNASTADRALKLIRRAAQTGSWLVLFTHDVSDTPGRYGVRPDTLETLLKSARTHGLAILPVGEVVAP